MHAQLTVCITFEGAFATFETIAEAGQPALAVDLPFQVGAISEQGFAQVAAVHGGVDGGLVDPGAAGVAGWAGTAAEQGAGEQNNKQATHDGVLKGEAVMVPPR